MMNSLLRLNWAESCVFYWKIHFYDSDALTSIWYRLCVSACSEEVILFRITWLIQSSWDKLAYSPYQSKRSLPAPESIKWFLSRVYTYLRISEPKPINYLFTFIDVWHRTTRRICDQHPSKMAHGDSLPYHIELIINLWHRWPQCGASAGKLFRRARKWITPVSSAWRCLSCNSFHFHVASVNIVCCRCSLYGSSHASDM